MAAHLVVIMGTQYYDGAHSQGANDYPVTIIHAAFVDNFLHLTILHVLR